MGQHGLDLLGHLRTLDDTGATQGEDIEGSSLGVGDALLSVGHIPATDGVPTSSGRCLRSQDASRGLGDASSLSLKVPEGRLARDRDGRGSAAHSGARRGATRSVRSDEAFAIFGGVVLKV